MSFGEKINNIPEYLPFNYSNQIRLDANESGFELPDKIKREIAEKIYSSDFRRYPDPYAKSLCEAFAAYYDIPSENVAAGNGSDELISLIMTVLLPKGSKILITEPDFSMYKFYCGTGEHEGIILNKNINYTFTSDDMIKAIEKNKPDFIIFSNPCNPTGLGLPAKDVLKIIQKANCTVCVDEAYMDFWNESILPAAANYDNCIVLKTCSKNIGLAAARVGFAYANKKIITMLKKAKSPYNLNLLSQISAETIFNNSDWIKAVTKKISKQKDLLYLALKELENDDFVILDSKTNFISVKAAKAAEIYDFLLKKDILIRLTGGLLRITAGTNDENQTLFKALKEWSFL